MPFIKDQEPSLRNVLIKEDSILFPSLCGRGGEEPNLDGWQLGNIDGLITEKKSANSEITQYAQHIPLVNLPCNVL